MKDGQTGEADGRWAGDRALRASDFDYQLPADLIAQHPSPRRGESRLLVVRRSDRPVLQDARFPQLPDLILPGDLLVVNSTRVRHARLVGRRPSGAPAEVLLIHPTAGDAWIALGTPGSALKAGKRIEIGPGMFVETVEVLEAGLRLVRFVGASPEEALARYGRLPLPPYITREPDAVDAERYQTVFAEREGSVAAPTAGLHFTAEMLEALRRRDVEIVALDLEVGPGTFKPVEVEDLALHRMHPERYEISRDVAHAVADARRRGARVWAVGTTVVRALESAADATGRIRPGGGETSLFITPGYRFRVVTSLITNFHLPRSTLLMLVCSFAGTDSVLAAYRHAIAHQYRFYSYGDAMALP